jgi:hypothetical protein
MGRFTLITLVTALGHSVMWGLGYAGYVRGPRRASSGGVSFHMCNNAPAGPLGVSFHLSAFCFVSFFRQARHKTIDLALLLYISFHIEDILHIGSSKTRYGKQLVWKFRVTSPSTGSG